MGLADALNTAPTVHRLGCPVGLFRDGLDDEDRAALEEMERRVHQQRTTMGMRYPGGYSSRWFADCLERFGGVSIKAESVQRHLRGDCSCGGGRGVG
jgi:hypothetical protein